MRQIRATSTTLAMVKCIYLGRGMSLHIILSMRNLSKMRIVMEQKLSKENQDPNAFNKRLLLSLPASRKENERLYVTN